VDDVAFSGIDELEVMWMEAVAVLRFKALAKLLPGGTEENHYKTSD
jgi:hypothetical protein